MSDKVNRRDFLKYSAATAATLSAGSVLAPEVFAQDGDFAPRNEPGRVVRVFHPGAMSNPEQPNSDPVAEVVEVMVDTAMLAYTGKGELGAAWREFIHPDDRVLIKINCLGSPNMATNEPVVRAIIKGLQAMGLPNDNMVVYDQYRSRMARAHFRVGTPILGVPVEFNRTQGHQDEATEHGSGRSHFAVAFANATAVINVPVIKDHDACGITMSMKNITHGVIDNPSRMHRDNCNPSIANIYNSDIIKSKVRVIVADGLRVMYDGGPQDNANKELHNGVYVSTDPVAIDTVGLDVVEQVRVNRGLRNLADDGRPCNWLGMAQEYGLGIHDRSRITMETHQLG